MKALIDSGVRWRRYHGLPLHPRLRATLGQVTEWYLCPLSIEEMLYKWRHKPQTLPAPDPRLWLDHSLQGYRPALLTLTAALLLAHPARAVLSGTKNIPGDYATLDAAITDLNAQGVDTGGVTLNLLAGNPETAPVGGYVIGGTGSLVLTTSSAANPVAIIGNGNTITANASLTAGSTTDAIFKLVGADWITLNGFTMQENSANTTTLAANTMTEWGVALLHVSTADGAQNNTIQNNTITLNRSYANTFGIYSNNRHSPAQRLVRAGAQKANSYQSPQTLKP